MSISNKPFNKFSLEDTITHVIENVEQIEACTRSISQSSFSFYMKELLHSYKLLLDKYAPFKVGDRVMLKKPPTIDDTHAPGWAGCKHFLIEGAKATVCEVSCGEGGFRFYLEFDGESYIDHEHMLHMVKDKHSFCFGEDFLEKSID